MRKQRRGRRERARCAVSRRGHAILVVLGRHTRGFGAGAVGSCVTSRLARTGDRAEGEG